MNKQGKSGDESIFYRREAPFIWLRLWLRCGADAPAVGGPSATAVSLPEKGRRGRRPRSRGTTPPLKA